MSVAAIIMIIAVVAYRMAGPLAGGWISDVVANFSPLAAVIVAGGIYLPRPAARWVPFGALLLSTLGVNVIHQRPLLDIWSVSMLLIFMLMAETVRRLKIPRQVGPVLATSVVASILFYLLSNSFAWLYEPTYDKSLAGWWQCLTTGVPGYAPTWFFGLKSLVSDLMFTGLMIAACHPWTSKAQATLSSDKLIDYPRATAQT